MAVVQTYVYSENLLRAVHITALIPVENKEAKYPLKTLYLLHGIQGGDEDWLVNTNVNRMVRELGLAVIMPDGENAFYIDGPGFHTDYGKFVGEELVDITRKMFNLSNKREDTFIAGLSMGGFGAIRNGLFYHDTFSYVGGFSSALNIFRLHEKNAICHYVGQDKIIGADYEAQIETVKNPEYLMKELMKEHEKNPEVNIPKFYLSCGTKDPLMRLNKPFRDNLMALGYDVTWNEADYGHEWPFWEQELGHLLEWLPVK